MEALSLAKYSIAFGYLGLNRSIYNGEMLEASPCVTRLPNIMQGFFGLGLHRFG
ncbi:hypothetical protein SAMN05421863_100857 [Nitrosomonas communis]|uniref:Uncharacterized protein n=1 Tax=Nitrosomonas communis TaxID=44574 RepID=A0A1I4M389_9PROT|nr:hypothetical protein SAMN05421863_100857 [Nitrosomonas communis]